MNGSTLDELAAGLCADEPRAGVLYGIGVGPGDPALISVRAALLLRRLDVVAVPRARTGSGVARGAVEPYVAAAQVLELPAPMLSDPDEIAAAWRARVRPLIDALDAGRTCGFATDGDPALYSTFAHAADAVCAARPFVPIRVVPGVASMSAAAARWSEPLVRGDERLVVLPASRVDESSLGAALRTADCVVLLKAGAAMPRIRALVEGRARGWTVRYTRRLGLRGEELSDTLDGLDSPADYMAMVVLRRPLGPAAEETAS